MIKLHNNTNQEIIVMNSLIREQGSGGDFIEIPSLVLPQWSDNDEVITHISNGNLSVSLFDQMVVGVSKSIDTIKNILPKEVSSVSHPFASKNLLNGKKLFRRIHGIRRAITPGANDIRFTIPYAECKITGIEITNCELLETASFKVLDTESGAVTTVPYYLLNQFGFSVNMPDKFYKSVSEYDADLFQGLVICLEYNAISNKDIGINFVLHEVKS